MQFKIGGFYETKDGGWFFVNKMYRILNKPPMLSGRFIYIDPEGYDEEITDITPEDLEKQLLNDICWVGKYHRERGLYQVWDGANKKTIRKLQ